MSYHANIVYTTNENQNFRRVLHTGACTQLVAMCIPVNGEIGLETHERVEQVFFILRGSATAILDGVLLPLIAGDVLVVPPQTAHNILNTGKEDLKIYTLYAPPNHLPERVHVTKADADSDAEDEAFGHGVNTFAVSRGHGHVTDSVLPGFLPDFEPHPTPSSPLENPEEAPIQIYDFSEL